MRERRPVLETQLCTYLLDDAGVSLNLSVLRFPVLKMVPPWAGIKVR